MSRRGDVPDWYNSEHGDTEVSSVYLKQRGRTWYARVPIPKHLQKPNGPKEIVRSLQTRSKAEAQRLRWPVVSEIMVSLERQEKLPDTQKALELAQRLQKPMSLEDREALELAVHEHADAIEWEAGLRKAKNWYDIATGKGLPVSLALERWLEEATHLTRQTAQQNRRAIAEFIGFADDVVVGTVGRREAGRFVSEHLIPGGGAAKTINRKISSLSSLWRWAQRRGHVEENPWLDQSIRRTEARTRQNKLRAYTAVELRALVFPGPEDPVLRDLIWLGLFTGARLNELCELRPEDVKDGGLEIRQGKTDAAQRWLPIPEPVAEIVAGRAKNDGWLFPDLKPGGPDLKRSWNVQKRVNRWIGKTLEDSSEVNFHSLRRSYATACEQVDLHLNTQSQLMGHTKPSLAGRVYAAGQSRDQLVRAQASVSRYIHSAWLSDDAEIEFSAGMDGG